MLDEVSFTEGYAGGAGEFVDYTEAVGTVNNGIVTFTNLKYDRYAVDIKWTITANVPVSHQTVQHKTCYNGNACSSAAANAYVETNAFPVDQVVFKRSLTVEKV